MYRRQAVVSVGLYNEDRSFLVEDYDLWSRIASRYKVANLSEALIYYFDNPEGISHTKRDLQDRDATAVSAKNISKLLGEPFSFERALGIRNLRLARWSDAEGNEVVKSADDFRMVNSAFFAQHQEDLARCPDVVKTVREDENRAQLSASFLISCSGNRLEGLQYLGGTFQRYPACILKFNFWKTLFVSIFGYDLYDQLRRLLIRR